MISSNITRPDAYMFINGSIRIIQPENCLNSIKVSDHNGYLSTLAGLPSDIFNSDTVKAFIMDGAYGFIYYLEHKTLGFAVVTQNKNGCNIYLRNHGSVQGNSICLIPVFEDQMGYAMIRGKSVVIYYLTSGQIYQVITLDLPYIKKLNVIHMSKARLHIIADGIDRAGHDKTYTLIYESYHDQDKYQQIGFTHADVLYLNQVGYAWAEAMVVYFTDYQNNITRCDQVFTKPVRLCDGNKLVCWD